MSKVADPGVLIEYIWQMKSKTATITKLIVPTPRSNWKFQKLTFTLSL